MPLLLIYPLLAHLAVLHHDGRLQWLSLMLLVAAPLWHPLKGLRAWAWLTVTALAGGLALVIAKGGGVYALFLPPVLIPLALLLVFAKTLKPGVEPMITRIARAMRGSLTPELEHYTRAVTWAWVAMFSGLTVSAIVLALWATPEAWSLGTNLLHYLALGAFFAIEYAYRRWRFRNLAHEGFLTYLRRLVKVNLRTP